VELVYEAAGGAGRVRGWAVVEYEGTRYLFPAGAPVPYGRALEGAARVISDCHFSVQIDHFIPGFLSYSVPVFLK
jgi:hypothetical protein